MEKQNEVIEEKAAQRGGRDQSDGDSGAATGGGRGKDQILPGL